MSLALLNDFCREVEQCEELNIKSEDKSLKTFLSNGDVDEIIASHPTEVRFHHIQPNKFGFPAYHLYILSYNFFIPSKRGNGGREREVWGCNGAKTCFMLARFSSNMQTDMSMAFFSSYFRVVFFICLYGLKLMSSCFFFPCCSPGWANQ